jgi:transcription factor IIIB subunit 2
MNNYRRSVTEVVYIVKVTTNTIQKRLEEFKLTPSSALTVDEFINNEFLEQAHDPPSYYERQEEFIKNKKTRKRRRRNLELGEDEQDPNKRQRAAEPQVELRRDADGFAIPHPPVQPQDIPIDPELIDNQTGTSMDQLAEQYGDKDPHTTEGEEVVDTSGKKKRRHPDTPIHVGEEWAAAEAELEEQISEMISDPNTNSHVLHYARAKLRAEQHMRSFELSKDPTAPIINMDTHIGEDEFADDPEVQNCLLSEEDADMKTKLWANENKFWLRKQQMKASEQRKRELGPPKATRKRKPKPRIGEGQASPASSAGEAAAKMLADRSWSRKINYAALKGMMHGEDGSMLGSATTSRAGSVMGDSSVADSSFVGSVAGSEAGDDEVSVPGPPLHHQNDNESIAASSIRASPAPSSIAETSNAGDDNDDWRSTFKRPAAVDDFGELLDDDDVEAEPGMGDVDVDADFGSNAGYGDDDDYAYDD